MSEDMVSLEVERARNDDLLRTIASIHVPLAVAAALTFHQAHSYAKAIVARSDYDNALNIAATALSRLIPVYTIKHPSEVRVAVVIDLLKHRFACGATELRARDGTAVRELSILRSDLDSAISLIKGAGLPFSFALSAEQREQAQQRSRKT